MATKKKATEPVVIRGSHSTRTEYPDGRVEFVTHWEELQRDVAEALASFESTVEKVVTITEEKVKKTRSKKQVTDQITDAVTTKKPRKKKEA